LDESASRLEEVVAKLRERGYRITPQRLAILRILTQSPDHPTVEGIFQFVVKDFPTTSLATVYKTVAVLKELHEVLELEFSQDSNRYDGKKPYPHPHVICVQCKRIVDPEPPGVDALSAQIAKSTGYRLLTHRLDFYGLCPECQK
jgi:Fur family peroxide stress response transcriptional regulator